MRLAVPRTRRMLALDNPVVNPIGEKVTCRAGPARTIPSLAGPATRQRRVADSWSRQTTESALTVSTTGRLCTMAVIRARR